MVYVDITILNETPWPVEEIADISQNSLTEGQILDHSKLVKEQGFKCCSDRVDMYGRTQSYGLLCGRNQLYGRTAVWTFRRLNRSGLTDAYMAAKPSPSHVCAPTRIHT